MKILEILTCKTVRKSTSYKAGLQSQINIVPKAAFSAFLTLWVIAKENLLTSTFMYCKKEQVDIKWTASTVDINWFSKMKTVDLKTCEYSWLIEQESRHHLIKIYWNQRLKHFYNLFTHFSILECCRTFNYLGNDSKHSEWHYFQKYIRKTY